jgi:hypothetical protein
MISRARGRNAEALRTQRIHARNSSAISASPRFKILHTAHARPKQTHRSHPRRGHRRVSTTRTGLVGWFASNRQRLQRHTMIWSVRDRNAEALRTQRIHPRTSSAISASPRFKTPLLNMLNYSCLVATQTLEPNLAGGEIAAYLCRRWTGKPLSRISERLACPIPIVHPT